MQRRARLNPDEGAARCLGCAYTLEGLTPRGACPECGRDYDMGDAETFTTRPPFIRWKLWLPGLVLSVGAGVGLYALMWSGMGATGTSLWLGVSVAIGCILGYRVRAKFYLLPILAVTAAACVVLTLMSLSLVGIYCGLVLAGMLLGPIIGGAVAGAALRLALKDSRFSQRSYLPVIGFVAAPILAGAVFGASGVLEVEMISTSEFVAASPQECWNALQFYEEVQHEPPLLLRLTLPRPLHTTGRAAQAGDTKTCVYTTGRLVKLVTEAEKPASLRFTVIEQSLQIEREVRLVGGEFAFAAAEGGTRITLTTVYEPMLTPRWAWRPAERLAVHTLHRYVIEGIERECEGARRTARAAAVMEPAP